MPADRFFTPTPLIPSQSLLLENEELHHLQVMRIFIGDRLELINGKGDLATAVLTNISKKSASLTIEDVKHEAAPQKTASLAIALPRFNRLEYLVEKGCELGITHFYFFAASGSEKKDLSSNQWDRLTHLSVSALKQSGRLYLPHLEFFTSLEKFPLGDQLFFGDTETSNSLKSYLPFTNATCFIGPEKGFTADETEFLKKSLKATGISLSHNILRVDTAAITAAVFLTQEF